MNPALEAAFRSWSFAPLPMLTLALATFFYWRGWRQLHRQIPHRFPRWRLVAFLTGMASLFLAIASPLDAFAGMLLQVHMIQHLLLMMVAPPLLLLGAPWLPLLCGLPRRLVRDGLGPFLVWPALKNFGHRLTHPVVGGIAFIAASLLWHLPPLYELALRSRSWHEVEHACFLGSALLFWWPVVQPWPGRAHWPRWTMIPYLLIADLQNTALAAFLTFYDRPLYPTYAAAPRLWDISVLNDQAAAGVIMWVPGSLAFLIPVALITVQILTGRRGVRPSEYFAQRNAALSERSRRRKEAEPAIPIATPPPCAGGYPRAERPFDLLTVPVIGRFLRARWGRRLMQAALLVVALVVMADGFFGSQTSSSNLAGVLPWNYWRALTVVALLAAGNLFCMACPFMLPRELGRRLGIKPRQWPRALRSKWLAVALLVMFFWAYEAFSLWDKPIWTAWLILTYFVAAFLLDACFRGASFCKFVCPIGQFQFINSLVSPLEIKVRAAAVCASCKTHDCLRGNETHRGCETNLYLPTKKGSLDCTFCLDCVKACPHDNIGLLAVVPGGELMRDPQRASLGRLSRRTDVAALALMLVFAAFAGAAAMTAPVTAGRVFLVARLGLASPLPVTTIFFAIVLLFVPAFAMATTVGLGRVAGKVAPPTRELLCRFSLALVPLGAAMWAAHFLLHLLSGYGAAWPVLQQTVGDWGLNLLGQPDWSLSGLRVSADTLLVLQTLLLDAGLLLTLYIGWRIARECVPAGSAALGLWSPWACLAVGLYASGVWIFLQPMQMRGMMEAVM